MTVQRSSVYSVVCSHCCAGRGEECRAKSGYVAKPHLARRSQLDVEWRTVIADIRRASVGDVCPAAAARLLNVATETLPSKRPAPLTLRRALQVLLAVPEPQPATGYRSLHVSSVRVGAEPVQIAIHATRTLAGAHLYLHVGPSFYDLVAGTAERLATVHTGTDAVALLHATILREDRSA